MMNPLTSALEASFDGMGPELLEIYKDLHRHPELSMQEQRTAGIAADYMEKLGYAVTREVGVTGVVGLLRNGDGPTVMLRGDMDALPMAEDTGLPYASQVTTTDTDGQQVGVAHSCGHDLHVTWAARFNAKDLDGMLALAERGSIFVPQPGIVVEGDGVKAAEKQFLSMGLPITLTVRRVIVSGDIALLISDWSLKGKATDGSEVNLSGTTADVARRGPEGWKYVIDNPFGTL